MIRYIPCGCRKCDFSEYSEEDKWRCDSCSSHKESYIKDDTNVLIGYATLKEFNEAFGTDWKE